MRTWPVALLVLAWGCGDSAEPASDGAADAAVADEARGPDATSSSDVTASSDATSSPDADVTATPDAGVSDAVALEDAAPSDASPRDGAAVTDGSARDGDGEADPYPAIMAGYRSWQSLSPGMVDISADIYGLCRLPTTSERAFLDSGHQRFALRDWANPSAFSAVSNAATTKFPEGAVIVKEKYARSVDGGSPALSALGFMRKRFAGFDPSHGDWEFAYWTEASGVTKDTTGSCGGCHASSSAKDFVFIDDSWRTAGD